MRAPKEGTIWFYAVSTANGGQGGTRRVRVVSVGRGDDGLAFVALRGLTGDGVERVSLLDFTQRATPLHEKHALRAITPPPVALVVAPVDSMLVKPLEAEIAKRRKAVEVLQREIAELEEGQRVLVRLGAS